MTGSLRWDNTAPYDSHVIYVDTGMPTPPECLAGSVENPVNTWAEAVRLMEAHVEIFGETLDLIKQRKEQ